MIIRGHRSLIELKGKRWFNRARRWRCNKICHFAIFLNLNVFLSVAAENLTRLKSDKSILLLIHLRTFAHNNMSSSSVLLPEETYCSSELGAILYRDRKVYSFRAEICQVLEPSSSFFSHVEYKIAIIVSFDALQCLSQIALRGFKLSGPHNNRFFSLILWKSINLTGDVSL